MLEMRREDNYGKKETRRTRTGSTVQKTLKKERKKPTRLDGSSYPV